MRGQAILLLTMWMFIFHAVDADCLLLDCHCAPGNSCSVPLNVQPAQTVAVVAEHVTRVAPPRLVAAVRFPEGPRVQPPQTEPPLLTPPRAPPV